MNDTELNDTELCIIEYIAAYREAIMESTVVLERIRTRQPCKTTARRVFDAALPFIKQARWFATTDEYAACGDTLLGLANEFEALREEARALIR